MAEVKAWTDFSDGLVTKYKWELTLSEKEFFEITTAWNKTEKARFDRLSKSENMYDQILALTLVFEAVAAKGLSDEMRNKPGS